MKHCELCSHNAEPKRRLCDACANMIQRLMLLKTLADLQAQTTTQAEQDHTARSRRNAAI